ncbi:MAG: hypothetical protein H0X30_09960 [Anaerolineae bacterium]|nr:hypothetical protein [Anaerolineae bacterium]
MAGWRLFGWILWRIVVGGIVLGTLYSVGLSLLYAFNGVTESFFYFMYELFIIALFGAVLGGILGIILGLLDSVVLVIHACFFSPIRRKTCLYRWSALLLALICTVFGSIIVLNNIYQLYGAVTSVTVIATAATAYFVWRLPVADASHMDEGHDAPANAVLFYIEK